MCIWNGLKWIWTLVWIRPLRSRDHLERNSLQSILDEVGLSNMSKDTYIWAFHKTGQFSVKSFTLELTKLQSPNSHDTIINMWRGLVPPRVELFAWLACLGKLNTKAKLAHLNIIPASQDICPLCSDESETSNHLFLYCKFSWQIWCWWFKIWNLPWAAPPSLKDLFLMKPPENARPFFKKIWWAIFYIISWSIWKERNERIFNNSASSKDKLCDLILTRLGWWIKAWGDPFPYSISEMVQNPSCLDWCDLSVPTSIKPAPDIPWAPPSPNGLKWNVDASYNPRLNRAAIGGVLRNHRGEFICIFSTPIPTMEINNAKVNAIFRAIQISLLNDCRIHLDNMIIESDSLNAVRWCRSPDEGPWNLNFHLNLIRNTLIQNQSISLIHNPRSSNHVADALAKQGLHRTSEFLAWI